jgi:hypothetical protein
LREELLFETEILSGPKNKQDLQLRESWNILPKSLGWRWLKRRWLRRGKKSPVVPKKSSGIRELW